MEKSTVDLKFGREAFGGDPAGYHAVRPGYPDWVFEMLLERGCLGKGTATFEIGAGTGIATQRLVEHGASPLVIIERDSRSADFLGTTIQGNELSIISVPFEDVELPENGFDFGISATAFHWLNEGVALEKIARLLRPGGGVGHGLERFWRPWSPRSFSRSNEGIARWPAKPCRRYRQCSICT